MNLLGIAGTNGAGKDTIGEILAEKHGWLFVSVTEFLRDELKLRDVPVERENLRKLSAEWRKKYGLGVLIDKAAEVYEAQPKKYKGLVISSLRNPGEADELHRLGGKIIWIDADPHLRFGRITSRQRSKEDQKSFKKFISEEQAEMSHGGHETALHQAEVKRKADFFIENNSDNLEEFTQKLEKVLEL